MCKYTVMLSEAFAQRVPLGLSVTKHLLSEREFEILRSTSLRMPSARYANRMTGVLWQNWDAPCDSAFIVCAIRFASSVRLSAHAEVLRLIALWAARKLEHHILHKLLSQLSQLKLIKLHNL